MKRLLSLAVSALTCACVYDSPPPQEPVGAGQSYASALRIMCEVDELAAVRSDEDPLSLGRRRTDFIQQHVDNPDAIYLRTMLSVKGPSDQAIELREEAKGAGLASCALADELEKSGLGGLSP